MKESQLQKLNFEKVVQLQEDDCPEYHYYILDIEDIYFISSTSDVSGKSHWWVELGEGYFKFTSIIQLTKFIGLLLAAKKDGK